MSRAYYVDRFALDIGWAETNRDADINSLSCAPVQAKPQSHVPPYRHLMCLDLLNCTNLMGVSELIRPLICNSLAKISRFLEKKP